MRTRTLAALVVLVVLVLCLPVRAEQTVGVAAVDITPDYPVRLSGFGGRRAESDGVTQKIWAKALAFNDDRDKAGPAVIVTVDNLGVPDYMRRDVAERLRKSTNLDPTRFAITSSHTHTAPMLTNVCPTLFGEPIPPAHQENIDRYTRELADHLEKVALAALADLKPARVEFGVGKNDLAVNRRTPGGPVDHDLPVMVVREPGDGGKIRAIYLSYACHCVTLSHNKISGDWAGYVQETLQKNHPGVIALTSIGCGADANPRSGVTNDKIDVAAAQGVELAKEVGRLLAGKLKPITAPISAKTGKIELMFDTPPTREEFAKTARQPDAVGHHARVQLARLDAGKQLQTKLPYLIQTFTFGDELAMVFLPGEVVVDYSLRLKREFDRERLWVNAYANDVPCYIPSERILKEGGYEGAGAMVYYDRPTRLANGLEDKIVGEVRRQVPQAFAARTPSPQANAARPNVLLITVDDMAYDTPGFAGGKVADITPNLDKLASEGLYVRNAHVTVAVCQPSRSVLMTGRYPHRNGAEGFQPIKDDVPTLGEHLRAAGYVNGIMAKVPHITPLGRMCWDTIVGAQSLASGRDPKLYHQHAKAFFEDAKRQGKPFFLMANSQDPHRPWPGSPGRPNRRKARVDPGPPPARIYRPDEVFVPPFLPNLPEVREEMAQYCSGARRADEIVGEVLRALKETGFKENTLVMFLSDNGISQPFAKSNCYSASTRTPWLIRWPGRVNAGRVDETHFISGIDFMPTVLDAAGVKPPDGMDGRSFVPLLRGEAQPERTKGVVTVYHETSGKRRYEMRCVQDAEFAYIYNAWSDGKTVYQSEPLGGASFAAMKQAAENDPAIAARVKLIQDRVREELYDVKKDPGSLTNLADGQLYFQKGFEMRSRLERWMRATEDPLLPRFVRFADDHGG